VGGFFSFLFFPPEGRYLFAIELGSLKGGLRGRGLGAEGRGEEMGWLEVEAHWLS
jgi:hypothetical protein